MKLSLATGDLSQQRCDLILLPLFEADLKDDKNVSKGLVAIDGALNGLLRKLAAEEDFTAKAEQSLWVQTHGSLPAKRVLALGLGTRQKFDAEVLRLAIGRGIKAAQKVSAAVLAVALPETREFEACLKAVAEGLLLGSYKFDRYKTGDAKDKKPSLKEARLVLPSSHEKTKALQEWLDAGVLVGEATNWARDLVNEPPNAVTPSTLAAAARELAKAGLKVEVLGKEQIKKLGMGMFLGVAQGSAEPPQLIRVSWIPTGKAAKAPALAFVGKAITFDSGGLSLKPTDGMMDMKTDMAGSAAVLGAMKVVAALEPPFPVHGYMGACENMPGGRAYKVGDVLKARNGKTVEITNTDAEGRLVLGDVLSWAVEQKPAAVIDLATLTGACMVALGHHVAGVFGSDDATVWEVLEAARSAGEEMWRLPLSELQKDSLKSEVADMKNTGERWGGAINAALFLKEFVGETPWVHLDIAGPATSPKDRGYLSKGATGCGVRTLAEIVRARMRAATAG